MIADLGWTGTIAFALIILAVPLLSAKAVEALTGSIDFRAILSSITAALAVGSLWVKTASRAVTRMDKALSAVVSRYEQQIDSDEDVKTARARLKDAEAKVQTTTVALERARDTGLPTATAPIDHPNAASDPREIRVSMVATP